MEVEREERTVQIDEIFSIWECLAKLFFQVHYYRREDRNVVLIVIIL